MIEPFSTDLFFKSLNRVIDVVAPHKTNRLLILMYHRFMSDDGEGFATMQSSFHDHVKFIKRYFTVVALEEYTLLKDSEKKKIKNPVALTVDDGYRSFYSYAFPILKDSSIPATVYLPVNFIEHGHWMWQDKNKYILQRSEKPQITLEWENHIHVFKVDTFEYLMESLEKAYDLCMKVPLEKRAVFSRSLANAADVVLPEKPIPEFEPLTWEEIKEMQRSGIYFGSHTMNHEILTQVDHSVACCELYDSKKYLEDCLGHEIFGFCYPDGRYNPEIISAVENCGYRYAVTTEGGYNIDPPSFTSLFRETPPLTGKRKSMLLNCYLKPLSRHFISKLRKAFYH